MPRLSEADLAFRKSHVGSSDIPKIANLTPLDWGGGELGVALEKLGLSQESDPDAAERQEIGHEMEEVICRAFSRRKKLELVTVPTVEHPEHPWASASLDRIAPAIRQDVEAKNVGFRVLHHWPEGARVPPPYVTAQVQWQTGVYRFPDGSRLESAVVAAHLGNRDVDFSDPIEPDPETFAMLLEVGRAFHERVIVRRELPEMNGSDVAKEYLAKLYPRSERELVAAPPEALEWAKRLKEAKESKKQAEADEELAANRLKAMIQDAAGFTSDVFGKLTWKSNKASTVVAWQEIAPAIHRAWTEWVEGGCKGALPSYDEIVRRHTSEKAGNRPLCAYWRKGF